MRSFRVRFCLCATHNIVVSQRQYAGKRNCSWVREGAEKNIRQNWHSIWVERINYSYTFLFYMNLWNSSAAYFFLFFISFFSRTWICFYFASFFSFSCSENDKTREIKIWLATFSPLYPPHPRNICIEKRSF